MKNSRDPGKEPLDGVIKFQLDHHTGPLPADTPLEPIQHWFGICRALDLIGRHTDRYQGAAYGNIAARAAQGFLVTGTQTGAQESLAETDIAWVTSFDIERNRVVSQGPLPPSSESLTHGQVFRLLPDIRFVIHVHSRLIWKRATGLGLSMTSPAAAYGTPAMATEVADVLKQRETLALGSFAMGGHEDGIVSFGRTPREAGHRLLRLYRSACELTP